MVEYAAMPTLRRALLPVICAFGLVTAACASRGAAPTIPAPQPVAAVPAAPAPVPPQADPVADLLAVSNRHLAVGERELQLGHLEMAKAEFNRALEVLLESPAGARSEP